MRNVVKFPVHVRLRRTGSHYMWSAGSIQITISYDSVRIVTFHEPEAQTIMNQVFALSKRFRNIIQGRKIEDMNEKRDSEQIVIILKRLESAKTWFMMV